MKRDETECSMQIQLMKSVLQSSYCIPVVKAFENYMLWSSFFKKVTY